MKEPYRIIYRPERVKKLNTLGEVTEQAIQWRTALLILAGGSVGRNNACHYPLKGHRQGKRIKSVEVKSILLGVLATLACREKTKRTWLEFSGGDFGLYILLQCLYRYMCTLDLWSKIRVTIATGPAKCRDKRGNCYRTGSNMSYSESEIRVRHSHEMEARQKLKGLCIDSKKV